MVRGVGLGEPSETEYAAFGEDPNTVVRVQRVDESLAVLTALWSGDRVAFDGAQLHVHTTPMRPIRVQQPRIPIRVAATSPGRAGPLRRGARYDGVFPIPPDPMNDFIAIGDVPAIRDAIGRRGDFDIVVNAGPGGDPAALTVAGAT